MLFIAGVSIQSTVQKLKRDCKSWRTLRRNAIVGKLDLFLFTALQKTSLSHHDTKFLPEIRWGQIWHSECNQSTCASPSRCIISSTSISLFVNLYFWYSRPNTAPAPPVPRCLLRLASEKADLSAACIGCIHCSGIRSETRFQCTSSSCHHCNSDRHSECTMAYPCRKACVRASTVNDK